MLQTEAPEEGKKEELKNMGRSSDVAFQAGRKVSAGVVKAQETFMANHNTAHAAAMAKAAADATAHKTSVWVPRNAVYIQTEGDGEEKKLPNMGRSSDVAFQAGRKVSAAVVKAQETFQANHNTAHAAAMAKAAADATAQKTSVWVPRNAVYAQKSVPGLPNMGNSADVAFQAGRKVSAGVVKGQQTFQAAHNTAHAAAMDKAAAAATTAKTNVWVPRNAVMAQKGSSVDNLPNMGNSQRVSHDS